MKKKIILKSLATVLAVSLFFNSNVFASSLSINNVTETTETSVDLEDNTDKVVSDSETNTDGEVGSDDDIVEDNSELPYIDKDTDTDIDTDTDKDADTDADIQSDVFEDMDVFQSNYIDENFKIPSVINPYSANRSSLNSQVIPSSYSSRDRLPAVRNQGKWGTCWSFAAVGAAEASVISKGLADSSIDLSELQLAYFFYNSVADPLGNTIGDKTLPLFSNYLDLGGNSAFTTFALASWVGVTDESVAPYETASPSNALDSGLAYDDTYHMQNAYWINIAIDHNEVKKMIMEHGAVATSYYAVQTTTYYNPNTYAYYYDGAYKTNHAVTIVGWDDDYSVSNFNASKCPTSNGAWLVRNSWGGNFGDNGYFWISYEDSAFTSESYSKAYVFDFESADNYDHNYQYDGAYGLYSYSINSGGSIANVFTATGNSTGDAELIEAVAFALSDVNVNYSIDIYTKLNDPSNPTSGTKALSSPVIGSTTFVGYYTVPLEQPVTVKEGNTFSVVITLSKNDGAYTTFFGDTTYQNNDWIGFTSQTAQSQSFRKYGEGYTWSDLHNSNTVARIKAFTTDTQVEETIYPTNISLNHTSLSLKVGNADSLVATILPENATDKSVVWESSNTDIITVDNGKVVAKATGTATISATTTNGKVAKCVVTVTETKDENPVSATGIKINSSSFSIAPGESRNVRANISPSNATDKSVTWTSSNKSVFTVDSKGVVVGKGLGTATLTAETKNGKTDQIQITVNLSQVSNLISDWQNDSNIRLKWDKQSDVSGYEIYRYNTSKKKYIKIATTTSNTYTNKKLSSGTSYKYKVVSFIKAGKKTTYGPYSRVLTATTATKKPTLSVSSTSKKAKLKWSKPVGVSGYEIYMSTNKSKGYTKVKTVNKAKTTTYTKTKLKSKKTYYFKVRTYRVVNGQKVYSTYSKVQKVKIK